MQKSRTRRVSPMQQCGLNTIPSHHIHDKIMCVHVCVTEKHTQTDWEQRWTLRWTCHVLQWVGDS